MLGFNRLLDLAIQNARTDTADVVVDATRHIVSTTATTIGGFVPLILFGGTFWPPLATAIAGGVAGSAIIALFTVPALYSAGQRRRAEVASEPGDGAAHESRPGSELATPAAIR